jgi:fluoride exporter
MTAIYIFIGGGLGAVFRYLIGRVSTFVFDQNFPISTLVANFLACIIVGGFMYGLGDGKWMGFNLKPLIIVGFCGGLSTFSTFSFETIELIKSQHIMLAVFNVILSVLMCLLVLYFFSKLKLN